MAEDLALFSRSLFELSLNTDVSQRSCVNIDFRSLISWSRSSEKTPFVEEMPHGHSVLIVLLLLCQILGLILFLRGFFPLKKAMDGRATNENLPPEPSFEGKGDLLPPKFGRVVIMLIDALRADFVYSEQIRMPFTQELIRLNKSFRWIKLNSVYILTTSSQISGGSLTITLYTLKLVCIFSVLFYIHFNRCWQE